jgi:hypothetical protein
VAATRENLDEAAYAAVLAELKNGVRDEPLMAKAYAEAEGDENKARALYLRWRSAKLMRPVERERRRDFDDAARLAQQLKRTRKPNRSWSHPRAYDFLLLAAVFVGLFLFNRDVHNAVVHLARGVWLR